MMKHTRIVSMTIGAAFLAGGILPAYVPTTQAVALVRVDEKTENKTEAENKNANKDNRMSDIKDRADREIERRVAALNALNVRIQKMSKVIDTQKTSLKTYIDEQVSALRSLQSRIEGDTDLETLKTDVQSITKSYRIFALVAPQAAVISAADRALAIAENMTTLGDKLQTRISEADKAGKNTAALEKLLADYDSKVADAKTQAQAAIDKVSKLTPDGGDKAKMEANLAALKDAKAKIQAAQQDFVAARKDAKDIVQGLKALGKTKTSDSSTATDSD